MIKIGLKGLAKFMTAGASRQRKILKDYKYPDPEGMVQAFYYHDARHLITSYHRRHRDPQWLLDRAAYLESFAVQAGGKVGVKYRNNARALRQYAKYFGKRKFSILPARKLRWVCEGVQINATPDLHVEEKGKEKIIKLEFSKTEPEAEAIKIITQGLHQAQMLAKMGLSSSSVLFCDIPRGEVHKGARVGSRRLQNIQAACQNIMAIYDGI